MAKKLTEEQKLKIRQLKAILMQMHPGAFPPRDSGNIFPLKVGIHLDIFERYPEISHRIVRSFLTNYAYSKRYLEALSVRTPRVDLDGNEAGEVTEEQAISAQEVLERWRKDKELQAVRVSEDNNGNR